MVLCHSADVLSTDDRRSLIQHDSTICEALLFVLKKFLFDFLAGLCGQETSDRPPPLLGRGKV